MSDILQGHGLPGCTTFYSNMGLQSGDCKNTVVLHRGHFLESAFRIMSTPIGEPDGHFGIPGGVETLKKKDASWIDVFWSNFVDDSTPRKKRGRLWHIRRGSIWSSFRQKRLLIATRKFGRLPPASMTDSSHVMGMKPGSGSAD
jgi:hypothetical protein